MSDEGYEYDPDDEDCWPELQDVVHEFRMRGCVRDPPTWQDHASLDTAWDRRYHVENPETGQYITILHTENILIAPDVVENWERMLGLEIDKPWKRQPPIRRGPWSPPIN